MPDEYVAKIASIKYSSDMGTSYKSASDFKDVKKKANLSWHGTSKDCSDPTSHVKDTYLSKFDSFYSGSRSSISGGFGGGSSSSFTIRGFSGGNIAANQQSRSNSVDGVKSSVPQEPAPNALNQQPQPQSQQQNAVGVVTIDLNIDDNSDDGSNIDQDLSDDEDDK
jgi:hypothetical protein